MGIGLFKYARFRVNFHSAPRNLLRTCSSKFEPGRTDAAENSIAPARWSVGACLVGCSWAQNSLSVEQLVQHHIHALGGRSRIEAVQSTITHAEYHEGSLVAPGAFIAKMRPYYRTICDLREKIGDVCEGYDGSAWEWYTDPGVTLRVVGAAAAATRHGTEFIDSLVDYRRTRNPGSACRRRCA